MISPPGRDDIECGSRDDDIYGGPAGDALRGEENAGYIVGGPGGDTICGDAPVASLFDTADILRVATERTPFGGASLARSIAEAAVTTRTSATAGLDSRSAPAWKHR